MKRRPLPLRRERTTTKRIGKCVCCGKAGDFTILLCVGPDGPQAEVPRYYIPNQYVRSILDKDPDMVSEVAFCQAHIRILEDGLRATIRYYQAEAQLITLKPIAAI